MSKKSPNRSNKSSAFIKRIAKAPGNAVRIRPGWPDSKLSTSINGTAGDIQSFSVPIGDYGILNRNQRLHFVPRDSGGRPVPGVVEFHVMTGLQGKRELLCQWRTIDGDQPPVVRTWGFGYLLSPGDCIIVRFTPDKTPRQEELERKADVARLAGNVKLADQYLSEAAVDNNTRKIDPSKTELEYGVLIKDGASVKRHDLKKSRQDGYTILPSIPSVKTSTSLIPNTVGTVSGIHTMIMPVGNFCRIPKDGGLVFSPRDKTGRKLKGDVEVLSVNVLLGRERSELKSIVNGTDVTFVRPHHDGNWISPGTRIVTRVKLDGVIDPSKTAFEIHTTRAVATP